MVSAVVLQLKGPGPFFSVYNLQVLSLSALFCYRCFGFTQPSKTCMLGSVQVCPKNRIWSPGATLWLNIASQEGMDPEQSTNPTVQCLCDQ